MLFLSPSFYALKTCSKQEPLIHQFGISFYLVCKSLKKKKKTVFSSLYPIFLITTTELCPESEAVFLEKANDQYAR